MFYETDLLSRRGGKFCIIWLAAHEQLKLQGRGSRNDLRQALTLNMNRTLKEILQYVQLQKLPEVPNQGSPRFSLYLSAMLTHGAVFIHHLQVKHEVAHLKLKFDLEPKGGKTSKIPDQTSVICPEPGSTDLIRNDSELFGQRSTTGASFGAVNTYVEKAISMELNGSFEGIREAGGPVALYFNDDGLEKATPERIRDDFEAADSDLEGTYTTLRKGPLSVSPSRITMKEIEPLQLADLQPVEVGDGFGGNANLDNTNDLLNPYENFFGEVPAIAPMEEDLHPVEPGPGTPGRPSLTRSNSKRGHDNSSEYSGTPSKRRPPFDVQVQPEPIQVDEPAALDQNQIPMELGELETPKESQEPLLLPRRGKRNRKLTVDEVTGISNDAFRKGMMNCIDTMRAKVTEEDIILVPRYVEGTAFNLFNRPSVQILSRSLQDLVKRNMVVRPVKKDVLKDDEEYQAILLNGQAQNLSPLVPGIKTPDILQDRTGNSPNIEPREMLLETDPVPEQLNMAQITDESIGTRPLQDVSSPSMPSGDLGNEPEQARVTASKDGSYAGSILGASTSRMDVSGIDRSCASPVMAKPSEARLETLKEASVEISSRIVTSHDGSPHRLTLADRMSQMNLSPIATSRGDQRNRRTQMERDKILEGEELFDFISEEMERVDDEKLTFRELVPPEDHDPFYAATVFENLLWLQKRKKITLEQEVAFDDIFIGLLKEKKENLLI